jgi:hypothetical protein
MAQIKILKRGSLSWDQAWAQLEAKYGNRECLDEPTGETWQYMTTSVRDDGRVEHQFRHRSLPGKTTGGGREYFAAHGTFDPEHYQ